MFSQILNRRFHVEGALREKLRTTASYEALENGRVEKVLDMFLDRFQRSNRLFDLNGGLNRHDSAELRNRKVDKRRFELRNRYQLLSFACWTAFCILLLEVMRGISKILNL